MISIRQGKKSFPCPSKGLSAAFLLQRLPCLVFFIHLWVNGQAVTRHLFACIGFTLMRANRRRRLSLGYNPPASKQASGRITNPKRIR